MELGCYSSDFGAANSSLFLGRARVRRVFDPYLPTVGSEAWRDTPAGVRPLWSCKAPAGGSLSDGRDWLGAIAGDYDQQYADVFAALPADARVAVCHEFENKPISVAQFRQLTERLVNIFGDNAPAGATFGIISDHYQWDPAHTSAAHYVSASEAADVRALCSIVDWVGIDVYASSGRGMTSFAADPGFQRWWDEVGQYAPTKTLKDGTLVPKIGVAERGITAETAATRQGLLVQDAADAANLRLEFYSYWQASSSWGDNTISDSGGKWQMRQWAAAASS
jgi:hypothetical protein